MTDKKREESMSSHDRLMAAITGDRPDRVPWGPEINAFFTDRHLREAGQAPEDLPHSYASINQLVGADAICGADFFRRIYPSDIQFSRQRIGDEIWDGIACDRGMLVKKSRYDDSAKTTFQYEPLLKTAEDFQIYRYLIESTRIEPDYESLMRTVNAVGDRGIITLTTPATPFMDLLMNIQGPEATIYSVADYKREVGQLFEAMLETDREIYRLASAAPAVEVIRPFEDTSTLLTSPEMFREYCYPALKEFADIIHGGSKKFIPHLCGHFKDLIADLRETGLDGIEAVTPPPTGNTPAKILRNEAGSDFIIIGGIDPTRFSLYTLTEVEGMIREILDEMRGDRRFILGCEEISIMAPIKNVMAVPRIITEEFSDFYN